MEDPSASLRLSRGGNNNSTGLVLKVALLSVVVLAGVTVNSSVSSRVTSVRYYDDQTNAIQQQFGMIQQQLAALQKRNDDLSNIIAAHVNRQNETDGEIRQHLSHLHQRHDELGQNLRRQHEELSQILATNLRGGGQSGGAAPALPGGHQTPPADLTELYGRFDHHPARDHDPSDAIDANCGTSPQYASWFAQGLQNRSVHGEDRVLYERLFRHVKPGSPRGTYVELGAYNGVQESNSRFYDVCLGWNGLLVEANPQETIWDALVENRPTAHRMHFAASCSEETANTATVPFYKVLWTNAGQAEGVKSAYENAEKEEVDMPCGSLTPFIQDLLGGRVTFMSLDVEGAEPLVLEQIDFSKVVVDVMIIENFNAICGAVCESRDRFRKIMVKAGYVKPPGHQFVPKSDLWFHPQSPFLQYLK